ncbi:cox cluster protein [Halobacteriales archaeon SW_6_65_15]|jgi:hypothetical protein|nr:MAG: cox cluster protein [Halobacteriales archaeon SW_6_65_15]
MANSVFDRETLLDISVNLIPLGMILFFVVLLVTGSTYEPNLFIETIALGLHVVPFVSLAILTYIAAHYL